MSVTTVKRFNWPFIDEQGEVRTRIYFPGDEIGDQDAAAFAKMGGFGEERGQQTPARAIRPAENKATTLELEGGENKGGKGKGKKGKDETLDLETPLT